MTAFWIWVLFASPLAVGAIIGLMLDCRAMRRIRVLERDVGFVARWYRRLASDARAQDRWISALREARDGSAADIACLRALSQDLCDMLGHDERVLRVEEGHWDGNTWCCPATTYRCARCGAEWEIQDLLADKKERT